MCREIARGNNAILRHLPAAGRVLSPASFKALAAFLESRLKAGEDEVVAEAARREGWAEFASRYPQTARVLQRRLWEAAWPGLELLVEDTKARLVERMRRWHARLPAWVRQVGQWLKQKLH